MALLVTPDLQAKNRRPARPLRDPSPPLPVWMEP